MCALPVAARDGLGRLSNSYWGASMSRRLVLLGAAGLAVATAVAGATYASAASSTGRAPQVAAVPAAAAVAPATFAHPGVLVSQAQLDFVRGKVQAGEQPWKAAYDQMLGS